MAYNKACVPIAREVGLYLSAAAKRRDSKIAGAKMYSGIGLTARANQITNQAHAEFNAERNRLLAYMQRNGCL